MKRFERKRTFDNKMCDAIRLIISFALRNAKEAGREKPNMKYINSLLLQTVTVNNPPR